jgi:hypothetical protein
MKRFTWMVAAMTAGFLVAAMAVNERARGNGGPFVVKYPNGDPAAKGVLARLDPALRPQRESTLRVVREDLSVAFGGRTLTVPQGTMPPQARVAATYTIENPTDKDIAVDFGFPILRGIYLQPFSMVPMPDVTVSVDGNQFSPHIISNSAIYGIIRQQARKVITVGILTDPELNRLVRAVPIVANLPPPAGTANDAPAPQPAKSSAAPTTKPAGDVRAAQEALVKYLAGKKGWTRREATLLAEYAQMDLGRPVSYPLDRSPHAWAYGFNGDQKLDKEVYETIEKQAGPIEHKAWAWGPQGDATLRELVYANLGPLTAIGEQKATQFLAQLALKFDKEAATAYEDLFKAWGGEVRERAIDMSSGTIRPREMAVDKDTMKNYGHLVGADPTIYARVEYLDENARLKPEQKDSCRRVLKNLDVIFTFAPMNLLHYQAKFPAHKTVKLTVSYSQYAFIDTKSPASYQLAYVLHPASLWDSFGPIHLDVKAPAGVKVVASSPLTAGEGGYTAVLKDKTGELFVAIDKAEWDDVARPVETAAARK